ncbi:MAG: AMP-dependent synthetase/ligase, partial [Solirubrobacteraceae bacterium]
MAIDIDTDRARQAESTESDPNARTLCEAFQATVALGPNDVALRSADGSVELTFGQYSDQVKRIAAGLAARGIGRGDTVALMMSNRIEFYPCDTAALHLGATPFSIYNTSSPEQIAYLFSNAQNKIVLAEAGFIPSLRQAMALAPRELEIVCIDGEAEGAITLDELIAGGEEDFDFEAAWRAVEPDEVLTLIYTSGTTGPPKGVQTTHANMLAQCRAVGSVLSIRRGDVITSYLPSAHVADRWSAHYNQLVFGIQIVPVSDPRQIAAVLPTVRPTIWGGVPRIFEKLVAALQARLPVAPDQLDDAARANVRAQIGLDRVRWIVCGAAPLSSAVHEFLLALGLPMVELYGMSETSCVVTVCSPDESRMGTVGKGIPGVEYLLADDGELLIRGPIVMAGYRNDPERTAEVIDAEGWLHSGDIVEIDDQGYFKIVDRKKELIINAAGKN